MSSEAASNSEASLGRPAGVAGWQAQPDAARSAAEGFQVRDLGLVDYATACAEQLVAEQAARDRGERTLFLLEHSHVVTLGRSADPAHVKATPEQLAALGVERVESTRGGDVTYHGPGQLVGYPIQRLEQGRRDARRYLRDLEEVLLRVLADHELEGMRRPGLTGVWIDDRKIGALGVRLNRWVTSHGFALNVSPELGYFELIVACGIAGCKVTSMERELGVAPGMPAVKASVLRHMLDVFP